MAVSTPPTRSGAPVSAVYSSPAARRSESPNYWIGRWRIRLRDEEKRQCLRRSLRCALLLNRNAAEGKGEPAAIPAECLNISSSGLYGIVPIGYGVAIGQRYTFRLTIGERGPEPGSRQVVSQQGEIVRAELLLGEDGYGDRVGIGVRLFGPRSGLVPMPATA